MKIKVFSRILVLIVLAALCAASLCACKGTDSKISKKNYVTIGRILPLTGAYSGYAQGTLETEKAAVEELNSDGGIYIDALDKKLMVRFLLEDSKSSEEGATQAAKRLIEEENVDVIVVSHTSETVNAVTKVCEEAKVPCFCTDSDLESWIAMGKKEYSFNVSPSVNSKLSAFSSVWAEKEISHIAIVTDGSDLGKAFAENVTAFCKKKSVKTTLVSSLNNAEKEITDAKADGVICYLNVETYTKLKKTIESSNSTIKAFMVVNEQPIQSILNSTNSYIGFTGTYTAVCWSPTFEYESSLTGQNGEELEEWWESEFLTSCPEMLGYKHGIMEITIEALKRAMAIDSESIVSAAKELNINTIFGKVKFTNYYMDLTCGSAKWTYDAHSAGTSKWSQTLTPEEFGKETQK